MNDCQPAKSFKAASCTNIATFKAAQKKLIQELVRKRLIQELGSGTL
jgi:hypothetical protein